MAGDANGLKHQAEEVNTLETDCWRGSSQDILYFYSALNTCKYKMLKQHISYC